MPLRSRVETLSKLPGVLALFLLLSPVLSAQELPGVIRSAMENPFRLSGEIGTYGELYSISGRDTRRPSTTGRLYLRPTLTFFDELSLSFNVLLSSEGRSFENSLNTRHQINQIGVHPQWSWGYADGGDFSESFTPLSLNGILIRGGGLAINPGLFRLAVVGGTTSRSGTESFDRYLYGARIGVGRGGGSFLDVLFLRVRDTPSRFSVARPDSLPLGDSTAVGTSSTPYQETPEENLVLGVAGALRMFGNAARLEGEVMGSAFTRDMTASQISENKVPPLLRGLYTPRLGSNADYAYHLHLDVNFPLLGFQAAYRSVGPGYTSLGTASLLSDQREILLGTKLHLSRLAAQVSWSRQNDNLLDQKLYTTIRQKFSGNLNVKPLDNWNAGFTGFILTLRNYASSDNALVNFLTLSLGTNQSLLLSQGGLVRYANFSYIFQKSADENPLRLNNLFLSHTLVASAAGGLSENFTLTPSLSLVASRLGAQGWGSILTASLTPRLRGLQGSLDAALTIGLSSAGSARSLLVHLLASYRLTNSAMITLAIRHTGFRTEDPTSSNYSEQTASLTLSQRF